MLVAMATAFAAINSPLQPAYSMLHHAPVHLRLGPFSFERPLVLWINESLMVLFFLLVGLELKRQILEGRLSTPRQVALPLIAALGGMAAPAAVFLVVTGAAPDLRDGWAVPTATDIVLALGLIALLGSRFPRDSRCFSPPLRCATTSGRCS